MQFQPPPLSPELASQRGIASFIRCPILQEPDLQTFSERLFKLTEDQGPHDLYLNFAGVGFLNARALSMLISLHKKLQESGGRLLIYNVNHDINGVFEATMLHTLLHIRQEGEGAFCTQAPPGIQEHQQSEEAPHCRILIVEDHPDTARSLKMILEGSGREMDIASDGAEALERFSDFDPDVMVLDLGLPRLDGYHVAARIRSMENTGVCIIAVTGRGEPESLQRAWAAGVDHLLVKPVDPRRLIALIEGTFRPVAGLASPVEPWRRFT